MCGSCMSQLTSLKPSCVTKFDFEVEKGRGMNPIVSASQNRGFLETAGSTLLPLTDSHIKICKNEKSLIWKDQIFSRMKLLHQHQGRNQLSTERHEK
uniref:Putative ovule protein n=1 Tax=Solanum chacoense TaxID=4108 RepID=A0A0V0IM21_SOLCH